MSLRPRLHEILDAVPGRRIVVYGDLVLDRFVLGRPKRISREAPVIILHFESQRDIPGGGGNAMANIAALGATVLPVGVVGDDEPGQTLKAALRERGIQGDGLLTVQGLRTVTKVRILAGGPSSLRFQVARYDVEAVLPKDDPTHRRLLESLRDAAAGADAATVSDYGYGTVSADGVGILRRALQDSAPVIADSRFALDDFVGVDGATPNLEELSAMSGHAVEGPGAISAAAESLRRRLGARFVAATRGSQGMTLVEEGGAVAHIPVYGTDQVADVTGAGDTVLATLTAALAAGATPLEAAHLANLAGGIVVMRAGTATLSPGDLHRAIDMAEHLS